jgi:VanZ family protein
MLLDSQSSSTPRSLRLAGMAALAYILVVIYASLQPFIDWRGPPADFGHFLFAPWPRWITVDDVLFNFAAYVPLGFLLALALRARWNTRTAVIFAAIICAALSLALETAQQYLPARIASNVDLLVNSIGGGGGALIASLFAPGQRLGETLALLRGRWFVGGARGDAVLVLAGLWLITQLHTPLVVFGNGDLRGSLQLAGFFAYTPRSYLAAEAGVVMLNVTGLGLLLASAARDSAAGHWRTLALIVAGGCALKVAAAVLIVQAPNPWSWLTPGLGIGLAAALALLLVLMWLPHRGRAAVALLVLAAAVSLVNSIPENPYRPAPSLLLLGRTSHILSFASMTRALSDLWPFLAMLCALLSLPGRRASDY